MSNSSASKDQARSIKKFLFDTEFDYSESESDIQSVTPKQLEESVSDAKKASFDEGYQKGVSDTNDSIARVAGDQLFVITGKIEELATAEREIIESFHGEVAQLTTLIIDKILPVLANNGAIEEVKNILTSTLKNTPKNQEIEISVHTDLVDEVNTHISTIREQEEFKGTIKVVGCDYEDKTDCNVVWTGYGIESYMQTNIQEVKQALGRLVGDLPALDLDSDSIAPEEPEDNSEQADEPENTSDKEQSEES